MTDERQAFEDRISNVLRSRIDNFRRLLSTERLSGGASQETYRLSFETTQGEQKLAMRRAPGGVAAELKTGPTLAVEAQLMQTAKKVGVPEPEIVHVLQPEDELGEGFMMEWLDGETLGARIVRSPALDEIRPHLARECGEILARIHAIDLEASGLTQVLEVLTPEELVEQTWERYKLFETPQPMIDFTARWLKENLPEDVTPRLVHNDFRNGNVMVSPSGVEAVLDWEIAHIGDPMRDLGWICTNSWRFGRSDLPVGGFGRYEDLFAGYEAVAGREVNRNHVKFWEVYGSFWWAVGCLGMAEHYRTGPDQTVERPAIGRRTSECQVDCVNLLIPGPVTLVVPELLDSQLDMPRTDELLTSVRDYLRGEVMDSTAGRTNFLARVAGNSLDIVLREMASGPAQRRLELERLQSLLARDTPLQDLRWHLVNGLRDGTIRLDMPELAEHLRTTVVNQIAIDQPKYSGFRTAVDQQGGNVPL